MSDLGVVSRAPGELELTEIEVADPGPGEVRVRLLASGVCHTDLHVLRTGWGMRHPILLGHEGTAVVETLGEGVEGLAVGDEVVLGWKAGCGECERCLAGAPRHCTSPARARRKLSLDGQPLAPVLRLGTFATRTVVHAAQAVKIPAGLPPEQSCLIGCGVATGVGSVRLVAGVRPGDTVAVIGCGAVGLSVIQGARIAGAAEIHAIDLDERKLEQARRFGATHTGPPEGGVDVVFDVVARPQTFEQALSLAGFGGTVVMVGVPGEGAATVPLVPLFDRRLTIRVSHGGDHLPAEDFPELARLALDGTLDLAAMVTRTIALDEVEEAFRAMEAGETIRSVILFP